MTAGTDVCEISKGEIENRCDVVGADCNGGTKASVNGDSDCSYEFVDEVNGDPVEGSVNVIANNSNNDVDIQVEENGGDVDCCLVERDCIVVGRSNGGEVVDDVDRSHGVEKEEVNESTIMEVVEPVLVDCQVNDDEVVEFDSSPKPVESQESQVAVIEVNEANEPVVESSETESGFEVEEAREPVVEAFEATSVVEEPAIETFEITSVVEPVSETSDVGGAMAMPEEESNLELVESQVDDKNVILEDDGSEVTVVDEVKSEGQPELISDAQVEVSQEFHLAGRSVAEYEKKLEEDNMKEIDNQECPVSFTPEVQSELKHENAASGTEHIDRSIDESQMETQLSKDFEDDQVMSSEDHVRPESEKPLEGETVVDPTFNEDQVPKPEDVSKLVLENQKYTQMNVDHEDSQVLTSADLVIAETGNEGEVPLKVETVGDPVTNEIKDSEGEVVSECVNESPNDIQLSKCQDAQILPSTKCVGSETENESEVPLETDCASDPTPSDNQTSQGSNCMRSETMNVNEKAQILSSSHCVRSQSENDVAVENSASFCTGPNDSKLLDEVVEDGDSLMTENGQTDYSHHGAEIETLDDKNSKDGPFCAPNDSKSEIEVENGAVGGDTISFHPKKLVCSEIVLEFGSVGPRQNAPVLWCDDVELELQNGDTEPTNGITPGNHVIDSHQNDGLPDLKSEFKAKHSSSITSSDLPSNGAVNPTSEILSDSVGGMVNVHEKVGDDLSGDGITFDKAACIENVVIDGVQSDGLPTTLAESSLSDATDGHDVDTEVITRPFHFLIKIPRFEDGKIMEKIRHAQLQVDEKTQQRDAIRAEIRNKRINCQAHGERFEAAKAEERAARRLVRIKRQEIDSLQSIINRVKNAISVDEIDKRIYGMEHMMQHETLPLKEEKEFIREIKRLKHLREQLASNMGSQEEVQQAWDQRDQNEEHLKKLKKELETLKDTVLKAEAVKYSAGKKYDEESKRLKELQVQFKAANDIRQEAYEHLSKLRGQLNEKHKNFRVYKDDAAAAIDYASRGNKEALHRLCVDQVEQLMELWNTDDDFRKEYVRCNMRSTVRRLRTLDGRSLGPDEDPPVLPAYVNERAGQRVISVPIQVKPVTVVANVEKNKQVSSAQEKEEGQKLDEEVAQEKIEAVKTHETAKPIVISGRVDKVEEEKILQNKEEMELARRDEELKKLEDEAKLKEQRRLEEKAKAKEALERKKKIAEKAEMRAMLRAQKEAEEREKEREKRMRKKEKKKGGPAEVVSNGEDAGITSINAKEYSSEVKESNSSNNKKPQKGLSGAAWFGKASSKAKPIPPPLRNRNRKRMQQWLWMLSVVVVILALFLLGNTGFFLNLKQRKGGAAGTF